MKLTLFTAPKCPKCPAAKRAAEAVAKKLGLALEVLDMGVEENMITALQHQVASTPSLVIDGETVYRGDVPGEEALEKEIKARL
jgi:glutaredoxin